ncbi:MAG: hypothetical protein ACRC7R_11775 [Sarcina sp.]
MKKINLSTKSKIIKSLWCGICIFIALSITNKYNLKFLISISIALLLQLIGEVFIHKLETLLSK